VSEDSECIHGMEHGCTICIEGVSPRPGKPTVERIFTARHDGECPVCNFAIRPGERIAEMSNGRYHHADCT
jgi:hypothetical protein